MSFQTIQVKQPQRFETGFQFPAPKAKSGCEDVCPGFGCNAHGASLQEKAYQPDTVSFSQQQI